jgi:hypothetical protein
MRLFAMAESGPKGFLGSASAILMARQARVSVSFRESALVAYSELAYDCHSHVHNLFTRYISQELVSGAPFAESRVKCAISASVLRSGSNAALVRHAVFDTYQP